MLRLFIQLSAISLTSLVFSLPGSLVKAKDVARSSCGNRRTVDLTKGYMKEMKVTDQGNFGNCFSHSGANLIDAFRYREAPPGDRKDMEQTSPLYLTFKYREVYNPSKDRSSSIQDGVLDSGLTDKLLRLVRRRKFGLCSQENVEDLLFRVTTLGSVRITVSKVLTIDDFFSNYCQKCEDYSDHPYRRKLGEWTTETQAANLCYTLLEVGLPEEVIPSPEEMAKIFEKSRNDAFRLFLELIERFCKGKTYALHNLPRTRIKSFKTNRDEAKNYKDWINDHFDRGDSVLPLAPAHCGDVLLEGRGYDGWKDGKIQPGIDENGEVIEDGCRTHASLIVGRRVDRYGRCQFLIRNSWGTSNSGYGPEWTPLGGDIWVDAETFSENVLAITYLDET